MSQITPNPDEVEELEDKLRHALKREAAPVSLAPNVEARMNGTKLPNTAPGGLPHTAAGDIPNTAWDRMPNIAPDGMPDAVPAVTANTAADIVPNTAPSGIHTSRLT